MALLYWKQGRTKEAEDLLREVEALMYGDPRSSAKQVLGEALNVQASMYVEYGKMTNVEALYRRSESLLISAAGSNNISPYVANVWNNLALYYRYMNRFEEAKDLNSRAKKIFEDIYGPGHPNVLAAILNNATIGCRAESEVDSSLRDAGVALEGYRKIFAADHPTVTLALAVVAYLKRKAGDVHGAERDFTLSARLQGARNPIGINLALTLIGLAGLKSEGADWVAARDSYERAIDIAKHPSVNALPIEKYARERYSKVLQKLGLLRQAADQSRIAERMGGKEMAYCIR